MTMSETTNAAASAAASEEDALLDPLARSVLHRLLNENAATDIHGNQVTEQNADDKDGLQGGQNFRPPTPPPTSTPTPAPTMEPTASPTSHPTLRGQVNTVRGMAWYDRNGNAARDSNVAVEGVGNDVEYSHGVGGVDVELVLCDGETGRESDEADSVVPTLYTTQGFDILRRPQVVRGDNMNGKYNLLVPRLERFYFIKMTAPEGFLLTQGVCNDSLPGWECNYEDADEDGGDRSRVRRLQDEDDLEANGSLGIEEGRSDTCVYVDKNGISDATLNFGVMKKGDSVAVDTSVALVLDFDDTDGGLLSGGRRYLKGGRQLLKAEDKAAIATVTAEVLAASLDTRLEENGIRLDKVDPKDVVASGTAGGQLAVALDIKGHYSPPPEIDFDYVVQSSINRDTAVIRRNLRDYNSNCRQQTVKVKDQGLDEGDFNGGSVSSQGIRGPRGRVESKGLGGDVYSTACGNGVLAPEYFETVAEIQALDASEVAFTPSLGALVYAAEEEAALLASWAMGPVAGIAGLIVLLVGALVFRRALGPRRADKYSELRITKDVDGDEERRFGEAGGAMDDGSVDSAFYSDDEELEETEKERRMRRKRKEKGEEQRRSAKAEKSDDADKRAKSSSRPEKEGRRKRGERKQSSSRSEKEGKDGKPRRKRDGKLAASQGSDDTESLGKSSSNGSEEGGADRSGRSKGDRSRGADKSERKRSGKDRSGKDRSERKKGGDGDDSRRERRGRKKSSGGDNAKALEEAKIV